MMGTAKVSNLPHLPMAEKKKPAIVNKILSLFQKQNKKKIKDEKIHVTAESKKKIEVTSVETLLKQHDTNKNTHIDDELKNFSFTTDDNRNKRYGSNSSHDSGYSESKEQTDEIDDGKSETQDDDDVIEKLEKLQLEEKKTQTVVIKRAPVRNNVGDLVPPSHPYSRQPDANYRMNVPFINTQTFTGGQVFVKPNSDLSEINRALTQIETNVQNFPQNSEQQSLLWQTAQEFVTEDESKTDSQITELPEDILQDCIELFSQNYDFCNNEIEFVPKIAQTYEYQKEIDYAPKAAVDPPEYTSSNLEVDPMLGYSAAFPTPPYSENVTSPLSVNSGSPFYPTDYCTSPQSSPLNSELEVYMDLSAGLDIIRKPADESAVMADASEPEKQKRTKTPSTSSMTMKQYKDLQKELAAKFSKYDCCKTQLRPCKEILEEHAKQLEVEDRTSMCVQVAQLDTNTAYGVLLRVLRSVAASSGPEHRQCALFGLLCERVLAQKPDLFLGDFGLGLLKAAALGCPGRPFFTRYLVQCVRAALKLNPGFMTGRDSVFHETDALGDTLVAACARAGDVFADTLAELVRHVPSTPAAPAAAAPPLFRVQHANTEGYTALHVACALHSAAAARLRVVHVLLEHARADLWAGDVKGGDTALHLAVNAAGCDLRLVMVLFRHLDRPHWKQLAHAPNRSSVTPLEYARSQAKSVSRPYPQEVLEFLKKCR